MILHEVHFDIDGVLYEKPSDLKRMRTKRGLVPMEGADKTIATIEAADDFVVASILTSRLMRRRSDTMEELSRDFPGIEELDQKLVHTRKNWRQRFPYRHKVDVLSMGQPESAVWVEDNVSKSVNAIYERMRYDPHNFRRRGGIILVGFGMETGDLPSIAAKGAQEVGHGSDHEELAIDGAVRLYSGNGQVAYLTALPSHESSHVQAMMDSVRDIRYYDQAAGFEVPAD